MRQRRAKIYRKMLHQYQMQFGFREPYQLLLDDTFALALSRYKIQDPLNQFGNVLQTKKVKPLITQCCMQVLYGLGKEHQATVNMAKEWERRMCNHREAIDPVECIKECVGKENKHRYIVASEKGELRKGLRENVAGLPMMHFTQAVMVLEPMSTLTKERIEEKEETKLSLPASEAGLLKRMPGVEVDIIGAEAVDGEEGEKAESEEAKATTAEGEASSGGRRRKRKAPNPLSVRKSKNPRLTMEEKLKKEAELKKQKQRNAARARMEATKLPNNKTEGSEGGSATAATAGTKRKRRRGGSSNKDAPSANAGKTDGEGEKKQKTQHQPKVNGGENGSKPVASSKPEGASKSRRVRSKKNSSDSATATAAAAPAAESSA